MSRNAFQQKIYTDQIRNFRKILKEEVGKWLDVVLEEHVPTLVFEGIKLRAEWAGKFIQEQLNIKWIPAGFESPNDELTVIKINLYKGIEGSPIETFEFKVTHNNTVKPQQLYDDICCKIC